MEFLFKRQMCLQQSEIENTKQEMRLKEMKRIVRNIVRKGEDEPDSATVETLVKRLRDCFVVRQLG